MKSENEIEEKISESEKVLEYADTFGKQHVQLRIVTLQWLLGLRDKADIKSCVSETFVCKIGKTKMIRNKITDSDIKEFIHELELVGEYTGIGFGSEKVKLVISLLNWALGKGVYPKKTELL